MLHRPDLVHARSLFYHTDNSTVPACTSIHFGQPSVDPIQYNDTCHPHFTYPMHRTFPRLLYQVVTLALPQFVRTLRATLR